MEKISAKVRAGGRYLIINADDFGVCEASNEAVEEIFARGTITSATLMTPCPGAKDAVRRAARGGKINAGLHLTFTSEWSACKWGAVSPREKAASLLDGNGHFHSGISEFARYAEKAEVVNEIYSQYNFMASRGVVPTHADNHMGSLYGLAGVSYLKETLDFCAEKKLPFRLPKKRESLRRAAGGDIPSALAELHEEAVEYAENLGVPLIDNLLTNTEPHSNLKSYEDVKNAYMKLIGGIEEGVSEIYLHPAKEDFQKLSGNWKIRFWEYLFLLDGDLKIFIEKENIKLISWREVR